MEMVELTQTTHQGMARLLDLIAAIKARQIPEDEFWSRVALVASSAKADRLAKEIAERSG